jgi:hypothetical protein
MAFSSTITHKSKSIPGVAFTVRRMGYARRVELDMSTLAYRTRQREIQLAYPPFSERELELQRQSQEALKKAVSVPREEYDAVVKNDLEPLTAELAALSSPEVQKQRRAMDQEFAALEGFIRCEWVRVGLVSLAGGDVDGMSAEELLESGPPELSVEIANVLQNDGKLSGEDTKNSSSPSTSDAPVDGTTNLTGAPAASITTSATASSSTPGK